MRKTPDVEERLARAAASLAKTKDKPWNLPLVPGQKPEVLISGKSFVLSETVLDCISRGVKDNSTPRRKPLRGNRNFDLSSPEYWDQVLADAGLTPTAGGSDKLTYVGSTEDLANVERQTHRNHGLGGGRRVHSTNRD